MINAITFPEHFEDKDTYIIGNWCSNGCQLFHKNRAQYVFEQFNVDWKCRKDVMDAFSTGEVSYQSVLDLRCSEVRKTEIIVSVFSDPNILIPLIDSRYASSNVIFTLVEKNNDEINEFLFNSKSAYNRRVLATWTTNKEICQKFIDNPLELSVIRLYAKSRLDDLERLENKNESCNNL